MDLAATKSSQSASGCHVRDSRTCPEKPSARLFACADVSTACYHHYCVRSTTVVR